MVHRPILYAALTSIAFEPINWLIGRILDRVSSSSPGWLQKAARGYAMLDLPEFLFVGLGLGLLIGAYGPRIWVSLRNRRNIISNSGARSIHVTDMSVSMRDAHESRTIAIFATCVHNLDRSFKPCEPRGRIACAIKSSGMPPWLLERAPLVEIEAAGEGVFTLSMKQRFPDTILGSVIEAADTEAGVQFNLRWIQVFIAPNGASDPIRVPLWSGIDVCTLAGRVVKTRPQWVELSSASTIRVSG